MARKKNTISDRIVYQEEYVTPVKVPNIAAFNAMPAVEAEIINGGKLSNGNTFITAIIEYHGPQEKARQ